ncbi:hypothetical protein [Actinokineospora iranica]|uniref:hypothetical protein n=1 Tax=Actinokineospora iranica TaxID=1271860 RepID=UPI0011132F31|nr:hypothetical protein [Actinokineospora iranica]
MVVVLFVLSPLMLIAMGFLLWMIIGGRVPAAAARWVPRAMWSVGGAAVMYAWGLWHTFALDVEEHCTIVRERDYDEQHGGLTFVPISRKCNAEYDLVPPYVNPIVFALLALAVVSVAIAVKTTRDARNRAARS